jgi:predicted nucleotidyltransferase
MMEKYALINAIRAMLSNPAKSLSVRETAKKAGISLASARTSLDYMQKKGIITLKAIGKTHQYKANLESPLCRQWKVLFNLDKLADSGIVEEITGKIPQVHSILLYGSSAKGTNDEKSDFDIIIIAQNQPKTILDFSRKLGKEANISVFSIADWKKKALQNKVFYENVIYDSIVLYGERPVIL